MRKITSYIILTLLTFSAIASDYSITDKTIQSFSAEKIKEIEIHCFCSSNIKVNRFESPKIDIEISGKMDSVGYHGKQNKPNGIASELLEFDFVKNEGTLVLISNEFTFIHHAFVIKNLVVNLPNGIKYRIIPIHYSDLEGRNSSP